jgi:DNA-directed RNA polymerase sigma subunit (sigma70/sigma32)
MVEGEYMMQLPIQNSDIALFAKLLKSEIESPSVLEKKEIQVLQARLLENKTLDQVGLLFGKTRQRISQWQNIAIRKLKKKMQP